MKKKHLTSKLSLNKSTITNLNNTEAIKGGLSGGACVAHEPIKVDIEWAVGSRNTCQCETYAGC